MSGISMKPTTVFRYIRRKTYSYLRYWLLFAIIFICTQFYGRLKDNCISNILQPSRCRTAEVELDVEELRALSPQDPYAPTVNLVIASTQDEDTSWTSGIQIPNLAIIRYYTDIPAAQYHAPIPKGREAMMYHTYFHDFYANLPDISILIHADETPWHVEEILQGNMTFLLNRVNLNEVERRGYVNLRIKWENACPAWINTTVREMSDEKPEEIYMARAFREVFSLEKDEVLEVMDPSLLSDSESDPEPQPFEVPEIIAQPCCSQFAVTREAIQRVRKEDYARYINWLGNTDLDDYLSGRFWEHIWQYLFTGKAVDCPVEWKAFCSLYGICFEDTEQINELTRLENERLWLVYELGWGRIWRLLLWLPHFREARQRLSWVDQVMRENLEWALERGQDEDIKDEIGDLYADVCKETPQGWRC